MSVAILNGTWLYKSDSQFKLVQKDLKNEKGIELLRRDRDSIGGGVACAYNSNLITLKKLQLKSLRNKPKMEILAARGKICNYKKAVSYTHLTLPTTPYV